MQPPKSQWMKNGVVFLALLMQGSLALSGTQYFLWATRGRRLLSLELLLLLLLLLSSRLSCFSRVRLCATPETAAHQAPLSLGFSRQEHWSGLPFPSPMRESEVAQSCLTRSDPMDCSPPGSAVHGIFQARVLEWGAIAWSSESQTPRTQGFSSLWNSLGSADLSNPIFQSRKYDHASLKMQPLAHGCPGKQDCLVKPKSEQGFPVNICLPCASSV